MRKKCCCLFFITSITMTFTNFSMSLGQKVPNNPNVCKIFGQPCTCPELGTLPGIGAFPGYCLPLTVESRDTSQALRKGTATAWLRPPKTMFEDAYQLACDCKSDVLSEDEVVTEVIKKYYEKDARARGSDVLLSAFVEKWPKSHKALEAIRKILGEKPTDFNSPKIKQERTDLMLAMRQEPILGAFYTSQMGCKYVNQKCKCRDGKTMGVCSIGRYFHPHILTCYCE